MIVECFSIIALVILTFIVMSSKKSRSGLAILPLIITPIMHILAKPISSVIISFTNANQNYIIIAVHIIALVLSGILYGCIATKFNEKSARLTYLILCGLFTVVLTIVLIVNSLSI